MVPAGVAAVLLAWSASCAPAAAQTARCLQALVPLAADSVPQAAQFAPAACPSGAAASAFHHDAALGVTRLARAVVPGEIVAPYPEFGTDMVLPGQMLRLVVASGAARVERQVEALQSARPGQHLFVRAGDGQILSVRYEVSAP